MRGLKKLEDIGVIQALTSSRRGSDGSEGKLPKSTDSVAAFRQSRGDRSCGMWLSQALAGRLLAEALVLPVSKGLGSRGRGRA